MADSAPSITFEVAGLTWHLQRRSFWSTAEYLADNAADYNLARIASIIKAVSAKSKYHELSPEQARAILARLTTPQMMELETKLIKAIDQLDVGVSFQFDVPKPLSEPHWRQELTGNTKLTPEHQKTLKDMITATEMELRDEALMQERVDKNYAIVLKGLERAKIEEEAAERQGLNVEDLIEDTLEKLKSKENFEKEREFVLSEALNLMMPLIMQNIYTLQGTCGSTKLTLRYVSKKEIAALNHICVSAMERERYFCAMSIAAINGKWCLKAFPPPDEALQMVDSWTDTEAPKVYDALLGIRDFVESLLPYVEALPYVKVSRDFWENNCSRGVWWAEHYTGIPGTGAIPPNEVIELFIQESLIEEKAVEKLLREDTLALQVAGLAPELAKSIQRRTQEVIKARNQQINYMLFRELPDIDTKGDGSFAVPAESTREELIAVAENAIKGGVDYHDLMAILLQRRKALMIKKMKKPESTIEVSGDPGIEGRSYVATSEQVAAVRQNAREERRILDEATLEFSQDAVENIVKSRKRALLVQGIDPYNQTDQSIDWGSAEHLSRTKNDT